MPRNAVSLADRFRTARQSFELGMKLGCSPAQARETMRQQEAERQWIESGERLRTAMNRTHNRQPEPAPVVEQAQTTPAAPRRWWLD